MIRVRVREDFPTENVEVVFDERLGPGEHVYGVPVIENGRLVWRFTPKSEFESIDDAILTLPQEMARGLFKALAEWAEGAGIRPENHERALGKMDATERHLGDMRALVAKTLHVELPAEGQDD